MITKEKLYNGVHLLKLRQYFNPNQYGMDVVAFTKGEGVLVEELRFKTKGLRGMAVPSHSDKPDIILLNKYRNSYEHNIDCAHEMMHLSFHSHLHKKTFNCFNAITANQDMFIEWQANEGSAEYCVPYMVFVPMVCEDYSNLEKYDISLFQEYCYQLGRTFNVPATVIDYRMRNLKWEIWQHLQGVPIENVELLSGKELRKRNIRIKSIPEIVIDNQEAEDDKLIGLYYNQ